MWYDYMTGNIWSDQENDFNHGGAGQSPSPTGRFIFLLFLWFLEIMILFEKKESEALGETTMLQTEHPSQQKFFDLLGTRKLHPPLHSATTQCLVNLCSSIAICVVLLPLTATRGQSLFIDRDLRGPFAFGVLATGTPVDF